MTGTYHGFWCIVPFPCRFGSWACRLCSVSSAWPRCTRICHSRSWIAVLTSKCPAMLRGSDIVRGGARCLRVAPCWQHAGQRWVGLMRLFPFRFAAASHLGKEKEWALVFGHVAHLTHRCGLKAGRFLRLGSWLHSGSLPPCPYIESICPPGYAHTHSWCCRISPRYSCTPPCMIPLPQWCSSKGLGFTPCSTYWWIRAAGRHFASGRSGSLESLIDVPPWLHW